MNITFYKKDSTQSFSIRPSQHHNKTNKTYVWVDREDGEGGQFDADEIADVIYNALDKYFQENH